VYINRLTLLNGFQAAVQRSFQLQMLTPSGSVLPPGGVITQEMRVVATSNVSSDCDLLLLLQLQIVATFSGDTADAFAHTVRARWPAAGGTDGGQWIPRAAAGAGGRRVELRLY